MTKALPPTIRAPLAAELDTIADIQIAIVYGSAAQDRLRPDSDVDIAVAGHSTLSPERLVEISHLLGRAVRREIDIIDLRSTKGLVFYEAMTKGVVVLVRDKTLMAELMKETVYYAADFLPAVQSMLEKRTGVKHG
jgi:predicted nucleotidyltransferase